MIARRLLARLSALSPRHRVFVSGLCGAALVSVALALALQRDARTDLFAVALRPEQVSEVVERLADWNVAYVASADNVRVDARRRNELLLRLSLAGIPHAHLDGTRELLEKVNPLTPQSVLDVQQRDGLAGDLAASLRGLPGVADARVIIAPAQEGAFVGEASRQASASVRVVLAPGASLSAQTAAGIRAFVAAGVPGLEPKRVALLDDRGAVPADGAPSRRSRRGVGELASVRARYGVRRRRDHRPSAFVIRSAFAFDRRAHRQAARRATGSLGEHRRALLEFAKALFESESNQESGSDVEESRTEIPSGASRAYRSPSRLTPRAGSTWKRSGPSPSPPSDSKRLAAIA